MTLNLGCLESYCDSIDMVHVNMSYTLNTSPHHDCLIVNWREIHGGASIQINETIHGDLAWWYMDVLLFFENERLLK